MESTELIRAIEQADDNQISDIIAAVINRYRNIYPNWEIVFLSLPRFDRDNQRRQAEEIIAFLWEHMEE